MQFKTVFVGEGRVGKTSVVTKWVRGVFDAQCTSTVQAGLFSKKVETSKGLIEVNLWDTAGQEEFHAVTPIYYKGAEAALIVYSVTDEKSFDRMVQWHRELTQMAGNIKVIVVANKIDLVSQRIIPATRGVEYANSIGCSHFEVSAKTGEGIDVLFKFVAEELAKTSKGRPAARSGTRGRKGNILVVEGDPSGPTPSWGPIDAADPQDKKGCC